MTKKLKRRPPSYAIRTVADRNAIREGCYWDPSDYQQFKQWASIFAIQSQGDWAGKPISMLDFQERDRCFRG